MKIITWLLFTFICLLPAGSMAQNKVTLSGKITDQHGTPVAQATIAVENTTSGTYTDDQGEIFTASHSGQTYLRCLLSGLPNRETILRHPAG